MREVLLRVLIHPAPDGHESARRGLPCARVFRDVGALDVELIRRREIVERRIPLRARVGLAREHEIAARRRHAQRLRPRIELRLLDRAEDARDGEVVGVARGGVGRIARELLRRQFRGGEQFAHRHERLALLLAQRLGDASARAGASVPTVAPTGRNCGLFCETVAYCAQPASVRAAASAVIEAVRPAIIG